jgi:hypothetical protein
MKKKIFRKYNDRTVYNDDNHVAFGQLPRPIRHTRPNQTFYKNLKSTKTFFLAINRKNLKTLNLNRKF